MARIPEDEIERIKREVSVRRLVEAEGVALTRHGGNGDVAGRCPFHPDDDTPSLVVTESKGLWHCFGCGAAGDAIAWRMRTAGVEFREAALMLLEEIGGGKPARACPLSVEMTDRELGLGVVGYYHEAMLAGGEGRAYLAKRGLDDEETIARFRLGYADRTLGTLIPERNRIAGGELRRRLQGLGLWRASGHEHAAGSVVVPIFDEDGGLAELYARKVRDDLRPGSPKHLYLPGPHRGVWNREALGEYEEVLLCEGAMDALTFWRWGLRNVTWAYGVEGLTEELVAALGNGRVTRVLIAYDGDAAGDRGAERHAERLRAVGLECFRVPIPRGQDVNSLALSVSDPADALGSLIRRAEWIGRGTPPAQPIEARELPPSLAAPVSAPVEPIASAVAVAPSNELLAIEASGSDLWCRIEDRCYRAQGLDANTSYGQLKVTLLATRGEGVHVDALDLTLARARKEYAKEAAAELGAKEETIKRDLGRLFLRLEAMRDERLRSAATPTLAEPAMTDEEREAALGLLRDPRLLDRILEDFDSCGVVGEETNKLVGYLAAVSRKLAEPLAVIIQSSSAAGKTSLMDAILAFVPEEERVKYSAITGQSLFYMSDTDLRHKVLALVEEEGAERASYALKLLQSEGELRIASTGKDAQTGRLVTHEYRVEGPVALMLTTTAVDLDEELQNRCVVLSVDESREQTRLIHRAQRERYTLEGLWAREHRARVRTVHRNAQRLLRPMAVLNPFARHLTFLDDKTRARRDHEKYLGLIVVIALLHQYQRETKVDRRGGREQRYIEVGLSDVALANRLASEVLGRTLDELPPHTRAFLGKLEEMVSEGCQREALRREEYRFSRRDIRRAMGQSQEQVRVHLERLVDLEYVLAHRGTRGQSYVYELVYNGEGREGERFVMGLIDVEALESAGTTESVGGKQGEVPEQTREVPGPYRADTGPIPAPYRSGESGANPPGERVSADAAETSAKNAYTETGEHGPSYPYPGHSLGAGEAR